MINIPFKQSKNGIVISVRVEPKASKKGISGIRGDTLKVKLTASPVEGRANEQLKEVLGEAFNVKKTSIKILRGLTSKNKLVEIEGLSAPMPQEPFMLEYKIG